MKPIIYFVIDLLLAAAMVMVINSCAYSIPNGGQAVITDVTDALTGQPITGMAAAAPSSNTHASARAAQSSTFWGAH